MARRGLKRFHERILVTPTAKSKKERGTPAAQEDAPRSGCLVLWPVGVDGLLIS